MKDTTNSTPRWVVLAGGLAAFGTYFCVYAFRKPFTAVTYEGADALTIAGVALDFKVALVIAHVVGYALSKLIGIRVISELDKRKRVAFLLAMIGVAELALIGFGLVKDSWWAMIMLFFTGLPLGLIWGIVFSYLEGRQTTEILGAMLSVSFIISSGVVKSVGAALARIDWIGDYWMAAATGLVFLLPLLGFVFWLDRIPPPDAADIAARTDRQPMDQTQRRQLLLTLGSGVIGIVLYYVIITIFRDVRDNFAAELWTALGYGDTPEVFAIAELPIALLSLLAVFAGYFIRSNRRALRYYHLLFVGSTAMVLLATIAFSAGMMGGAIWMVTVGLGLYLGYVPLNAIYFDRLIGAFRQVATAGFLIYVADACGYAGSVGVLLIKNFASLELSWLDFFVGLSYLTGGAGLILSLYSWSAFERRLRRATSYFSPTTR